MWTDTTRAHHARAGLALPRDLTDGEWALLEPFFPPPSHVGRPRKWPMRMLPPCFPLVSTVRRWFYLWRDNRLGQTLNHYLLMASREANGREARTLFGRHRLDQQPVQTSVRSCPHPRHGAFENG